MAATELQFRKITFTSCCNENDILEFKYTSSNYGPLVYPNPAYFAALSAIGFKNTCYTVQTSFTDLNDWTSLPSITSYPPSFFNKVTAKEAKCSDYIFPNFCPECNPQCYTLYNCDGLSFNSTNNLAVYATSGQPITIYNEAGVIPGTWYVFEATTGCSNINNEFEVEYVAPSECECRCFETFLTSSKGSITAVTYIDCDGQLITNSTATKFCSKIYPIVTGKGFEIIEGDLCFDGLCPEKCFKLTNCDTKEVIYSTLQSLSQYVNTSSVVTLLGYEGCWEVEESTAINCDCITVTIEDRSGVTEYTATNIGTYNGWGVWQFTVDTDIFYIWNGNNNPSTNWIISLNSYGASPGTIYTQSKFNGDCPETISDGTLTGWLIQDASPWINVQTEVCPGPCECPVDVTVLQEFDTCGDCEPTIAYKLQNCEKIYEVQYTTQDLSEYIDSVIETDCGCWTVIPINYTPPSETLIVIDNVFKTCNNCLSKFYVLIDCAGEADNIVTTTDLSDYIGTFVKIENCDTCWEVKETREFTELSNVVVVQNFETCEDCGVPSICECTKITNLNEVQKTYTYYDCDNVLQSITLQPGESSDKVCVLYWVTEPLFCSCIKFEIKGQSYYAFIVPGELFNGKPFYTLCEIDDITTCGYVYWDGSNWVISDSDDNLTWILPTSTSESCPYGDWEEYNQEVGPNPIGEKTKAAAVSDLTSQPCDLDICTCITFTTNLGDTTTLYVIAIDGNGYPIYSDGVFTIQFSLKSFCWVYGLNEFRDPYLLCDGDADCPIGNWERESGQVISAVSIECPPVSVDFTYLDHFETFGECKFGNCPQPVFKNNRTVKPGYNTPICSPEKYDKITCKFADIMYKLALEKRYGITNCCPEEDDKWLIQKELIDLQALKDPNYKCQECGCGCNNNSCQTCNCKN
jgi:hypothetical protein